MRVAVLYNAVSEADSADARDVLVQRDAVCGALQSLGHAACELPCTLDLQAVQTSLTSERPDVVFNLVEALGGTDRLQCVVPALLESLRVPCTGASATALLITGEKSLAKRLLHAAGLPTPAWCTSRGELHGRPDFDRPFIIKPVAEHASLGMDDNCVLTVQDSQELQHCLVERFEQLGVSCFAEQFVAGREFNLSLLARGDEAEVLPPAEIDFSAFPPGKPRIVGFAAKWEPGSFEYESTPRSFEFSAGDGALLNELLELARAAWDVFELRGYARVDFRVDERGRPWILEINANPCLSPDAGFAAALQRAGIEWSSAVRRILDDAKAGRPAVGVC